MQHTVPNAVLLALFECPVCAEHCSPPFTQCRAGHLTCNECLRRMKSCPLCRDDSSKFCECGIGEAGELASVSVRYRNLSLENVAELIRFPCKYAHRGCENWLSARERQEHERECLKRYHTL